MQNRTDIDITKFTNGIYLYRGMSIDAAQCSEYSLLKGTDTFKYLHGYTSTSLDRNLAMSFAENYGEGDDQKYAVLLKIFWNHNRHFYLMDMSSYAHEQEVLLLDGKKFVVTDYQEWLCKQCQVRDRDYYEKWICKHCTKPFGKKYIKQEMREQTDEEFLKDMQQAQ